jgi:general stress protein CsbA
LVLTAVLIAQKFNDNYFKNSAIASIGGVQSQELQLLEEQFLDILEYNVAVGEQEYTQYEDAISKFFTEPMEISRYNAINDIKNQIRFFQQQVQLLGIDALSLTLPPLLIQAQYTSFLKDQLVVIQMLQDPNADAASIRQ